MSETATILPDPVPELGRPPLPEGAHRKQLNVRLAPDITLRMKVIAFRRTIARKKPFSEGALLDELIGAVRLPKEPSAAAVRDFATAYPGGRNPNLSRDGTDKVLVNCQISPESAEKLKLICQRRSVHRMKPMSEGAFISGQVIQAPMPPPPKPEQIYAYLAIYPKQREKVERLSALTPRRLSRKRD